jgi:glycosyltransferase 2 family protein
MTDVTGEDRATPTTPRETALQRWIWPFARGAIGLALFSFVLGRTDAVTAFSRFLGALWLIPALLALTAYGASIEAERLRIYFGAAGLTLGWSRAYVMVAVGTFFNMCIPGGTGGDMAKLFYLAKDNRQRGPDVAAAILVDRLVALSALLATVTGLSLWNIALVRTRPVLLGLSGLAAAGLATLALLAWVAPTAGFERSRLVAWLGARQGAVRHLAALSHGLAGFVASRRLLLAGFAISLAGHAGLLTTFVLLTRVVAPGISISVVALLASMGMLANAIPITPGGLGVGEAAFEQLFRMAGMTGGASLVLAWRIAMLPLAAVGVLLYTTGRVGSGPRTEAAVAPRP